MENLVKIAEIKEALRDKKVFVTGHSGFKGTWLTAILHLMGAQVKGYSLPPEDSASFFNLFPGKIQVEHVFADIRDVERLNMEVKQFAPDYIFHLAAQPLVLRSYREPAYTFDVNVTGTVNLLHALTSLDSPCSTLVTTTDKVYENKEQHVLYKEGDRLGGHDPYSASKACAELAIQSMRDSYFSAATFSKHRQSIAVGRAGNVIGGGDWSQNRIVPDIARSLIKEETILLRNPEAIRPWQHVLEPLMGYIQLAIASGAEPAKFGCAFNFGPHPSDHLRVEELTKEALKAWGSGGYTVTADTNKPHEAGILQLDITKAAAELNWTPKLDAKQAIKWAIDWYKQEPEQQAAFTLQQIDDYFLLCK